MQPASASPVPEAAAPRNVFSVLLDIFFEPKAAFREILVRPRWWLPMVLSAIFAVTFSYLLSTRVGWETVMRKATENNEQVQNMPKEQREQMIATQTKIAGIAGYAAPLVFIPVGAVVIGAVLMFIFNGMFGGAVKFQQALGIVTWSWIPTLLSSIAAIIILFVKSPEDIDINNPVGFNIGFYLSDKVPKWLMSLASSIDLFTLWVIALLAAGFAVATKKSWTACLIGVLMPWALYVLVKVGWAAFMG